MRYSLWYKFSLFICLLYVHHLFVQKFVFDPHIPKEGYHSEGNECNGKVEVASYFYALSWDRMTMNRTH